jgi:DNA polymerase III subunit epsilon
MNLPFLKKIDLVSHQYAAFVQAKAAKMLSMTHNLTLKRPLAFIDIEATGVSITKDRIVELSIIKAMPDGSVDIKTRRINPEMWIPAEATKIHGITNEDLKDEPKFKEIAKSLVKLLEGCDLAGYNSNRFDIPMLVEEFLRCGVEFDYSNKRFVDVQRIFHQMEPRTLSAAYKFYCGKKIENAHSAEADTMATLEVLCAQINHYKDTEYTDADGNITIPIVNDIEALSNFTSENLVDFARTMIQATNGDILFNIGKHKGKLVSDVLKTDPNFYDWYMKGDFAQDSKRKLTAIKLGKL